MAELTFRLVIENAGAQAKLDETGQKAGEVKAKAEQPISLKVQAENALGTIRDLKIAFEGVAQVVTKVVGAVNGFLDAALEARQSAKLASLAFGDNAKSMSDFAQSMQEVTNFEGDQLLALMAKMAQTYNLNTSEIQRLTPALLDFTEANKATGMSVETSFDLMGRALNGHTEMLGRYGIELDNTRLKTEGVSYLVQTLGERYGGTAIALADLRLQNANTWGDVKETIGDMLQQLINPLLAGIKELLTWFNQLTSGTRGVVAGLALAIPVVVSAASAITALSTAVSALWKAMNPVVGVISLVAGGLTMLGVVHAAYNAAQKEGVNQAALAAAEFDVLASKAAELGQKVNRTTEEQKQYTDTIRQMQVVHPGFLSGMDAERVKWSEVAAAINETKVSLAEYINLEARRKVVQDAAQNLAEMKIELGRLNQAYTENSAAIKQWENDHNESMDSALERANEYTEVAGGGALRRVGNYDTELRKLENLINRSGGYLEGIRKINESITTAQGEVQDLLNNMPDVATALSGGWTAYTPALKRLHDEAEAFLAEMAEEDDNAAEAAAQKRIQEHVRLVEELDGKVEAARQAGLSASQQLTDNYAKNIELLNKVYGKEVSTKKEAIAQKAILDEQYDASRLQLFQDANTKEAELVAQEHQKIEDGYTKRIELLRAQKDVGLDVNTELLQAVADYLAYCEKAYGKDSKEYFNALKDKQQAQKAFDNEKRAAVADELDVNALLLKTLEENEADWFAARLDEYRQFCADKKSEIATINADETMSAADKVQAIKALENEMYTERELLALEYNFRASQLAKAGQNAVESTLAASMTKLFSITYKGTNDLIALFTNMANAFIAEVARMMAKWVAFKLLGSVVGAGFFATGGLVKKADGGFIRGPGTATSDSIPAMLSNGEYVVNAFTVKRLGTGFFDALNYGGRFPVPTPQLAFAAGGAVGDSGIAGLLSTLITKVEKLTQVTDRKQLSVQNNISADAVVRTATPAVVNEINARGGIIRGEQ